MTIAPQNIMAKLRGMHDAELAQYANMHQQDPYIFPLAFQESQNRQHLRAANQAKMMGQAQPKVVQQDLQQMSQAAAPQMPAQAPAQGQAAQQPLPEDVGIGQLPAPNLQKMAGGGIIAFEEGGHVPSYAGPTDGSLVQLPGDLGIYGQGSFGPQVGDAALQQRISRIENNPRMRREDKDMLIAQARQEFGLPKTTTIPAVQPVAIGDSGKEKATSPRIAKDEGVVEKAMADKAAKDDKKVADKDVRDLGIAQLGGGNFEKTIEKFAPKEVSETSAEYAARREKEVGPSPIAGQQERLNKQEESAKGDKADALNMALIKAGLGMMSGTSQHALANIGEGAKGGLADYAEAMKDLKKAAIERDKARDALENAQYAYKRGDFDAYEKLTEKAKDRTAAYNTHAMSAMGTIDGHKVSAGASIGAARMNRDAMMDYRNSSLAATIRNQIAERLGKLPEYKMDATKLNAEIERQTQLELQKYGNLAQFANAPTGSSAAPTLKYNPQTGKIE
jgi:hypothetical protein